MIIPLPDIPTFILMVREVSQGSRECREVLQGLLCISLVVLSQIGISPLVLPPPIPLCTVAVDHVDSQSLLRILLCLLLVIERGY